MFLNLLKEMTRYKVKKYYLANQLGISRTSLTNKLTGKNEFTLSEIDKIKAIFPDYSYEYLFMRD